jgi:hypothetical protein
VLFSHPERSEGSSKEIPRGSLAPLGTPRNDRKGCHPSVSEMVRLSDEAIGKEPSYLVYCLARKSFIFFRTLGFYSTSVVLSKAFLN